MGWDMWQPNDFYCAVLDFTEPATHFTFLLALDLKCPSLINSRQSITNYSLVISTSPLASWFRQALSDWYKLKPSIITIALGYKMASSST